MNINEECLLLFLNNPGRLEFTTNELKEFVYSSKDKAIKKESAKNSQSSSFERLPA